MSVKTLANVRHNKPDMIVWNNYEELLNPVVLVMWMCQKGERKEDNYIRNVEIYWTDTWWTIFHVRIKDTVYNACIRKQTIGWKTLEGKTHWNMRQINQLDISDLSLNRSDCRISKLIQFKWTYWSHTTTIIVYRWRNLTNTGRQIPEIPSLPDLSTSFRTCRTCNSF